MSRCIDADALVTVCLYDDEHEERYTECMSVEKCLDLLTEEGCPKIADRPQGEWMVDISDYKSICAVCGAKETEFIYGTEMWYGLGESKFCPNCGSQMFKTNENPLAGIDPKPIPTKKHTFKYRKGADDEKSV